MDTNYYSDKILSDFVITNLCQKDKLLQKYYSTSNISKFRKNPLPHLQTSLSVLFC